MMHESDQASLLEGAFSIAQTGQLRNHTFYNYDKQFGSYWIVATVLRFLGATPDPNAVVLGGNAVSVVFFNAGLVLLSLSVTSPVILVLVGILLFAPSFLIHPPFLAGNYLSAFFLFAQFIALRKQDSLVLPMLLAFCASACRADAVLAQPILLWSSTRAETLSGWLSETRSWGCGVAAGAALLLGKAITAAGAEVSSPFALFVHGKILAVYSVFGLGAGIGILLLGLAALLQPESRLTVSGFTLAGLMSLLLPFGYYAVNLYSTRHWTVALVALMCFVASVRGQRLIAQLLSRSRLSSAVCVLLVLAAVLPLVIGFGLSSHGAPRLTLTRPALVPSADGLLPLGGYLGYAWGWDRDERLIPDHNQATWLATLAADFGAEKQSPIRLLVSPLASIVRLGVRLRGFEYELTESPEATPVYAEFRALRKRPIGHSQGKLYDPFAGLSSYGVEFASPIVAGEAIVRLTNHRNSFTEDLLTLREAFDGNDYHFSKNGATAIARAGPGHIAVLVSPTPFRLNLGDRILIPKKDQMIDGEDRYLLRFVVEDAKTLTLEGAVAVTALSVLPQFMTVENY
ncbi:MAG TPA: hypothetical protein VFS35_00815 [Terrimicrobiaceae bacterium]|nr:hypothetical protein [Terrimicrobiaceae bacterium]